MGIPGDDLPLQEIELLQAIGKYQMLYEHEQRKRMVLAAEYDKVVKELEELKFPPVKKKDQ